MRLSPHMSLFSIPFYQRLDFKMETYSLDPRFAVGGHRLNFCMCLIYIQRHSLFVPPPPQASIVISAVLDVSQSKGRRLRDASFREKCFSLLTRRQGSWDWPIVNTSICVVGPKQRLYWISSSNNMRLITPLPAWKGWWGCFHTSWFCGCQHKVAMDFQPR